MAGFQQYNFFPTDLLYPRPQPSVATLEPASAKPTTVVLPMQNAQEQNKKQTQHKKRMVVVPPPTHAHLSKPKHQPLFLNKLSTHAVKPHSWAFFLTEEHQSDAFY
ncbi:uncharacterized protein HKW66_Vig0186420 [Vigna angularis]|uniref:Uncharacterized protein n=1 Tax=Phaseolus angularis TaxID=3914 RepID=A0A8T0L043_PHAAN|nr:uncharacterized protein HKW66_Vig0186420 [Vigna angularis]